MGSQADGGLTFRLLASTCAIQRRKEAGPGNCTLSCRSRGGSYGRRVKQGLGKDFDIVIDLLV